MSLWTGQRLADATAMNTVPIPRSHAQSLARGRPIVERRRSPGGGRIDGTVFASCRVYLDTNAQTERMRCVELHRQTVRKHRDATANQRYFEKHGGAVARPR